MRPIFLSTLLLLLLLMSACGGATPSANEESEVPPTVVTEPTTLPDEEATPMTAPDDATPTEADETPTAEAPDPTEEPTVTPTLEGMPGSDAGSNLFVGPLVMIQLSAETGIDIEAMEIVSIDPIEWPNAALGCPEPGQMYTDMIVPGYRILIEAQGETFDVGTDEAVSRIAICDKELE